MKIIVLSAGMVGRAIAFDLSQKHEVTSADISSIALSEVKKHGVNVIQIDLSNFSKLHELVNDFDLVVSAVPGFMGYRTIETLIACGKNVVDISFMPEDFMELNQKAIEKINDEYNEKFGKKWVELDAKAVEFAKSKGVTFVKVSKEDEAFTAQRMKPILDGYVKMTKAKGLPGDEALKFIQDYLKTHQ